MEKLGILVIKKYRSTFPFTVKLLSLTSKHRSTLVARMGKDVAWSEREVEQIHPWMETRICNRRIAEKLYRNHKVVSNYFMKEDS